MTLCQNGLHERTPENVLPNGCCATCVKERKGRRSEVLKERYRSDPEYRERVKARMRKRQQDPEVRERYNARRRERYRSDPEYRARHAEAASHHYRAKDVAAQRRERYRNDPEYRAHVLELQCRARERRRDDAERHAQYLEYERILKHARRRAEGIRERKWRAPKNRSSLLPRSQKEMLDARPFLRWWEAYRASEPLLNPTTFIAGAGFDIGVIRNAYAKGKMALDLIDKALVQAGESPITLLALYPWPACQGVPASIRLPVCLPEPVKAPLRVRNPHDDPTLDQWEPPPGMFTTKHLALLMRIRAELHAQTTRMHERYTDHGPEAA